jgi:predicted O-methyltransferase YrrM
MDKKPDAPLNRAGLVGPLLDRLYRDGRILGDDGVEHEIMPVGVTRARGEFIASLCRSERPAATLEVGMAWGLSTLFILDTLIGLGNARPGCHVVMDPYQETTYHNAALRTLRDMELADLVEFHAEPSGMVLPRLIGEGRSFDFIFIDGDHRFDGVFTDFFFAHQLLRPGGLIVFDDPEFDGVYLTCRFAESNYGYMPEAEFPRRRRKFAPRWQFRRRRRQMLERPLIRAYRKPLEEVVRGRGHFVQFFDGFVPLSEIPRADPKRVARNALNHRGRVAMRGGNMAEARRLFGDAVAVAPWHIPTRARLMRTYLPGRLAMLFSGRSGRRS